MQLNPIVSGFVGEVNVIDLQKEVTPTNLTVVKRELIS